MNSIIGRNAKSTPEAAARLEAMSGSLSRAQSGFAWACSAMRKPLNQNMPAALSYYSRADRSQLSAEQFEWYARAALRLQRWSDLAGIINSMPAQLKNTPDWRYWLARSYAAQGQQARAKALYEKSGRERAQFLYRAGHRRAGRAHQHPQ